MRIGGVPEHFNLPWQLAIEEGFFKEFSPGGENIPLEWTDFPGGTGAMTAALRNGELDLALLLTEGIVADIVNGNDAKLLKIYVQSPLNWGIFVNDLSDIQSVDDLAGKRYAVSRMGSGSHLMACVNALQHNWNPAELPFVPLQNLDGMRRGLRNGEADAFMWEKVMTQPHVDSGELRRVGVCPTPWPCFVLAARREVVAREPEKLEAICEGINTFCRDFKNRPRLDGIIAERYQLPFGDVRQWLQETEWATDNTIDAQMLGNVMDTLLAAGVINTKVAVSELVWER